MEDFSWINTIISAIAGIAGGVIGAKITNKSNKEMHINALQQNVAINLRKERNEEQKVINKKVLDFIAKNPNSEIAKIINNVKGDNENLSEDWSNMIHSALHSLLYENKIEENNPEQWIAMFKEYKVKE
ncbi:hypothetical protein [Peribacillus frigoritolerans]|uniref:hypothetical protein n=1 Tax=Peribacillus frigoritolerans TaxID=450367 RepID=UPI0032E370CF